jgi:hypothetical protein
MAPFLSVDDEIEEDLARGELDFALTVRATVACGTPGTRLAA